ncbi:hypothetical protein [Pseudofulvibacter geojedonensis]|uniref:Lipocalin-like domain-containing protein n=1 Tax=Pseudofulvibacter geojedonensis TaxID=1123758 RepID=A0ABW3I1D1_9FLAO
MMKILVMLTFFLATVNCVQGQLKEDVLGVWKVNNTKKDITYEFTKENFLYITTSSYIEQDGKKNLLEKIETFKFKNDYKENQDYIDLGLYDSFMGEVIEIEKLIYQVYEDKMVLCKSENSKIRPKDCQYIHGKIILIKM